MGQLPNKLKRRKILNPKPSRTLVPDARRLVAQDIFKGKAIKQVAGEWGISIAQAHTIFHEHLQYKIVWKQRP